MSGPAVRVRLFAAAREAAGAGHVDLALPDGATTDDVWNALPAPVQAVVDRSSMRLAVNGDWVEGTLPLSGGDEVAVMTPVSGGC